MKKDKLDLYIKKQLEETTIEPSKTAWNRLEARMENTTKTTQNFSMVWMSAAGVILFGVMIGFFWMNKQSEIQPMELAQKKKTNESINNSETKPTEKQVFHPTENFVSSTEKSEPKENTHPNLKQKPEEEILLSTTTEPHEQSKDSSNTKIEVRKEQEKLLAHSSSEQSSSENPQKEKKKNYVDPEMLLYSIENKQNIEKSTTQSGNAFMIYDFNR